MPSDFKGNVFITGAAAGIGAAATRLLADAGYTVYAGVHKDTGSLDRLAGIISQFLGLRQAAAD